MYVRVRNLATNREDKGKKLNNSNNICWFLLNYLGRLSQFIISLFFITLTLHQTRHSNNSSSSRQQVTTSQPNDNDTTVALTETLWKTEMYEWIWLNEWIVVESVVTNQTDKKKAGIKKTIRETLRGDEKCQPETMFHKANNSQKMK